ncbi:MAG: transglutaminase family protein, partial [Marinobacter sp.]|nr:transglutaminase family protein [Marinobacter sp.]
MTSLAKIYLQSTPMLDFHHERIQQLVDQMGWRQLVPAEAARSIYLYVRDEIAFGYNKDDTLSASQVLRDGYGQCNTKGTLLMALLRAVGI